MESREFWEDHHARKRTVYPTEEVVRFLAYAFPKERQRRGKRALDLGAGSGRHTVLLARWGFDAYGCDYSYRAAVNIREFLRGENEHGRVTCGALDHVPFRDNAFHVVLPWECIFYGDKNFVTRALGEVYRVLEPGGWTFLNLRSPDDLHAAESDELAPGVFLNRGEWAGVVFSVFTEDEARALFRDYFEIVWFDPYLISRRNGQSRDSGWMVLARKK